MKAKLQIAKVIRESKVPVQTEPQLLYRIYKTVLQIVDIRGYVVPQESMKMKFSQFYELYLREELRDKRQIFPPLDMDDTGDLDPSIAVFFNFSKDFISQEYIKRVIQSAPRIRKFLLIAPTIGKMKANMALLEKKAQTFVQQLAKLNIDDKDPVCIEIFKQDELLFNVLKHQLVPKHIVLTDREKLELLEKYKVKQSQLPKIQVTDPVSKFLGLKRGQIVKIVRKSETAGTYQTYRICI